MIYRKSLEERANAEERASEVEKKLSDLTSQINSLIHANVTETLTSYSPEQTLNTVSSFALIHAELLTASV